jgi:hypothetical protein
MVHRGSAGLGLGFFPRFGVADFCVAGKWKWRAPSAPFLMVGFIQATLGYRGKRLDVPELS